MADLSPSLHRRAIAMLVFANVFWGLSFPTIKTAEFLAARLAPSSSGWFFLACSIGPRFAISVVVLGAWLVFQSQRRVRAGNPERGITRLEWRQGAWVGLFAGGGMLFQCDGLRFTTASTSAFLTQFYAILIPVWLALRHRKNPGIIVWCSCLLVVAGTAVLGHFDWRTLHFGRGEWETLLCSVFFMIVIFILENPAYRKNRSGNITWVMFATLAMIFGILALVSAPNRPSLSIPWTPFSSLGLSVGFALVCTIGPFSLMNAWQPKITATEAGLIYCLEPVFASLFALFMPALYSRWQGIVYANETATSNLVLGGGLIILANVLLQLKASPSAPESSQRSSG